MKRTLTINISGTVFHIDEDAYEKLQSYLMNISRHFGSDPEGKEIIADIEARIAELFSEKLKPGNQVVTIQLVDEIIEVMGRPEDFAEAEEEPEVEEKRTTTRGKRLYRDPDNRVIAGVCGGLGAYFNIDPVIIRLIVFFLFLLSAGTILLIYILFWIVVPRAKNTAQRLEMRGKDVNIENIKRSIKDEFEDVKESYQRFRSSETYEKGRRKLDEVWVVLGGVLRIALKVLIIVIGIAFMVAGIVAIISLLGSLFLSHELLGFDFIWGNANIHGHEILNFLADPKSLSWFWVSVGIVVGIPLLALVYLGSKIVFTYRSNNALVGLSAFALWIIGIIMLVSSSLGQVKNFKRSSTYTSRQTIKSTRDTLYLKLGDDRFGSRIKERIRFDDIYVANINGKDLLLGKPEFDIEKSSSDDFVLVMRTYSKGESGEEAYQNAREVAYSFSAVDSLLVLDPWFQISEQSKWRGQEVDLILRVPEGKTVYLEEGMEKIIHDIENTTNTWDGDMPGYFWKMKPDGLTLSE